MGLQSIAGSHAHDSLEKWEHLTSTSELLLACGTVVLSVLGIVGLFQDHFAAIAIIALGVMLLLQGVSVAMEYNERLYGTEVTDRLGIADVSRGLAAEFLAGTAGIVLGILALLNIGPLTLMSVAVITYGGTLLLTSGEPVWLIPTRSGSEKTHRLLRAMSLVSVGTQALVGAAGLVLGILALVGIMPIVMVLIGLLASGTSILLRSSVVGGFLGNTVSS